MKTAESAGDGLDRGLAVERLTALWALNEAGLGGLTEAVLASKAPFSPGDNPEETVGSLLAGLVFHEGYHCGQLKGFCGGWRGRRG